MEAYLEVRRKEASKIYDECMELLGDGFEQIGLDNLTASEKRGLKSLKKKVKEGVLIICQTDMSGRFCVMSREDYRMAGSKHTSKDREITNEENEEIQRALNGHMRWWGDIWNVGSHWNQKDRCKRNLLNFGLAVCPMTLLIKDHKTWSVNSGESPPSRSVMGGNIGGNTAISEFVSLVLEPVAK
jgi:hypothetical protein